MVGVQERDRAEESPVRQSELAGESQKKPRPSKWETNQNRE